MKVQPPGVYTSIQYIAATVKIVVKHGDLQQMKISGL